MEILFVAVFLFTAWHTIKYTVPRAGRAVANRRNASIARWRAKHPKAPASARWLAGAGHSLAALRWGPKFLAAEFKQAWAEGWRAGKEKFRVGPPQPVRDADGSLRFGGDPTDPTGVGACPTCRGSAVVNGRPCPDCLARQEQRNADHDGGARVIPLTRPTAASGATSTVVHGNDHPYCVGEGRYCTTDGHEAALRRSPAPITPARRNTMTITTATGGEVTSPEQLAAEVAAIAQEAAAELEDAAADARRADEDAARVEKLVASLQTFKLPGEDIAVIQGLLEPAQARKDAAEARQAAAEKRHTQAQAAATVAQRHIELQGQGAAGEFYRQGA